MLRRKVLPHNFRMQAPATKAAEKAKMAAFLAAKYPGSSKLDVALAHPREARLHNLDSSTFRLSNHIMATDLNLAKRFVSSLISAYSVH